MTHMSLPFNFQRLCLHRPGNESGRERELHCSAFEELVLFVVTLRHPRSEDFVVVALKGGSTR